MKKINVKINKLVYLGKSILDKRKITMYKNWYDYLKPKNGTKDKLCEMDADSFIVHENQKTST